MLQTLGTQRRAGKTWAHPHPTPPRPWVGTNLGGPAEGKGGGAGAGSAGKKGTAGPGPHARQTGSPKNTPLNSRAWDLDPMVPGLNCLTQRVTMAALRDPGGACSRCLIEPPPPPRLRQDSVRPRGLSCYFLVVSCAFLGVADGSASPPPPPPRHPTPKEAPGGAWGLREGPQEDPLPQGSKDRGKEGSEPAAALPHPGRVSPGTSWAA